MPETETMPAMTLVNAAQIGRSLLAVDDHGRLWMLSHDGTEWQPVCRLCRLVRYHTEHEQEILPAFPTIEASRA